MSILDDALSRLGVDVDRLAPPDNVLRAAGALLQGDYLGATIDKLTFYSQYTAPVVYETSALKRSDGSTPVDEVGTGEPRSVNPWGVLFKPTLVVESPLRGKPYIFAPYGVADPEAYKQRQALLVWGPIGVAALIAGSFFFLGRASKR